MTVVDSDPTVVSTAPTSAGPETSSPNRRGGRPSMMLTALRALAGLVLRTLVTMVVVVLAWIAFLRVFSVNPLVGKTPLEVWQYLVTDSGAGAHRSSLAGDLWITLVDAGVGFVVGLALGAVVAVLFHLYRPVEQAFLPIAILVRSLPLVAMAPLVALVFGQGLLGVVVLAGTVVFFPTLVSVTGGLRSVRTASTDLIRAYGGGRYSQLFRVALPTAVPALFAAARMSVPGALVGGLVAEWLATGKGMGSRLETDIIGFEYADMWAGVVTLTLVSLLLYGVVAFVETVVLARMGRAT
jgi:ABC-type nitrate/sulfonate/bicarbonate transport system permease component